jgi:hypothetical protein
MKRDGTSNRLVRRLDERKPREGCVRAKFPIGLGMHCTLPQLPEPGGTRENVALVPAIRGALRSSANLNHRFIAHSAAQRFTPTHF